MQAKVTTPFKGRPDGEALARDIAVGEIIIGDLAAVAVRDGNAEEVSEGEIADEAPALDDMTVDQLKAFAADKQIDLGDATKKADIRAAIDAKLAA